MEELPKLFSLVKLFYLMAIKLWYRKAVAQAHEQNSARAENWDKSG